MSEYRHGIGLMSGTSLDGVDMALCQFSPDGQRWTYRIGKALTIPYPANMRQRLAQAHRLSALEYARLNVDLGEFFANCLTIFTDSEHKPQFIASHGHTVFHQPETGLTTQIGSGAVIAARTGIPVVCDFRTTDVALHGQGAPLVPIGDELLFSAYDACLNLGGIANISYQQKGKRIAHDICPCNMALNYLAGLMGHDYDTDGEIAAAGTVIHTLQNRLENLAFYRLACPKSLGREWFENNFLPALKPHLTQQPLSDCLRTVTEHIALQIAAAMPAKAQSVLVTGGGAHNKFLIRLLEKKCSRQIIVPDKLTVDYKEALIFAFLGMLRLQQHTNCLCSVTGSEHDSCSGAIYL